MSSLTWIVIAAATCAACSNKKEPPPAKEVRGSAQPTVRPFAGAEDMIAIPGGRFQGRELMCAPGTMTPTGQGSASVGLQVTAYKIDRDVVTCAQLQACEAAGACHPREDDFVDCHGGVVLAGVNVAREYCAWRQAKLPTYRQWQRAGRGAEGKVYPWGNEWQAPDCDPGSGGFDDKRCLFETAGFKFEARSNAYEWTADLDCAPDLRFQNRPLSAPAPAIVVLGGYRLDEEHTISPPATGEFRCARQVIETTP